LFNASKEITNFSFIKLFVRCLQKLENLNSVIGKNLESASLSKDRDLLMKKNSQIGINHSGDDLILCQRIERLVVVEFHSERIFRIQAVRNNSPHDSNPGLH